MKRELGWSEAGSLLQRPGDDSSDGEAHYKKYADDFTSENLEVKTGAFLKCKVVQILRVAHYGDLTSALSLNTTG